MIAIGCDHAGIDLKPAVIEVLTEMGLPFKDYGTFTHDSVDYPVLGEKAALAVAAGECELGVVLCGTGQGIGIAANKVRGVRCAICADCYSARMSREHNNANMIALGSRVLGTELAKEILRVWFTSAFEGDRHARRVNEISILDEGGTLQP